ncbi:MAG TPA: hypothetical protein VD836_11360, partial [Solirubrobacteraceae bacterium]|nr:hypothetical protein [Solirubrobacteraceae bacterium]
LVPIAAAAILLALPPAAGATYPGSDGRLVWKQSGKTAPEVRTGRLDGRGHRKVGEIADFVTGADAQSGWARWSPSGRRLLWFDIAGDGVVVESAGGRRLQEVVRDLRDPDWSPDGRELIGYDERGVLRRVGMDGRLIRELPFPDGTGTALWPRWSPTGEWIVVHEQEPREAHISRIRPDGSGFERLTDGWRPSWSPDGRHIAFERSPDVYTMRADGSGIRRVFRATVRETAITGVAWSPDGRRIAIATDQYENESRRPYRLLTVPAGGGKPTVHRRSTLTFRGLDWQAR